MTTETDRPLGLGLSEGLGAVSEACHTCRYFLPMAHKPGSGLGNCRRYPPVADGIQLRQAETNGYDSGEEYARNEPFWWGQPCVLEDEWCGEWLQAPNDRAKPDPTARDEV